MIDTLDYVISDKQDCFARKNESTCNALTFKDCKCCKFYKKRSEIKNNPFYAYSYAFSDTEKFMADMKKRQIKSEQVIWK